MVNASNISSDRISRLAQTMQRIRRRIIKGSISKSKSTSTKNIRSYERNINPSRPFASTRSISMRNSNRGEDFSALLPTQPEQYLPYSSCNSTPERPSKQPQYTGPRYWEDLPPPETAPSNKRPVQKRSLSLEPESAEYSTSQHQRRRLRSPSPSAPTLSRSIARSPSTRPRKRTAYDDDSDTGESNSSGQIRTPKRLKNQLLTPPPSTKSLGAASQKIVATCTPPRRASPPSYRPRSPGVVDTPRGRQATIAKRPNNFNNFSMPPPRQKVRDPRPRSLSPLKSRFSGTFSWSPVE